MAISINSVGFPISVRNAPYNLAKAFIITLEIPASARSQSDHVPNMQRQDLF
uniref:Uncharacterized protein n=1 Tax=Rhizophora mucronata TaxID=61149 RepID=A0A2P2J6N5_RHIMU